MGLVIIIHAAMLAAWIGWMTRRQKRRLHEHFEEQMQIWLHTREIYR